MTSREFRDRLARQIVRAGVDMPHAESIDQLRRYFDLLRKWNARINLTGLPMQPPTGEALDRLFVEPLAAAAEVPDAPLSWFDLGTGGGSPAIPLKVVRPALRLTMVESKTRKAAFLREVVRGLNLPDARVENSRLEEAANRFPRAAQLITLRAVRIRSPLVEAVSRLLSEDGELIVFRTNRSAVDLPGLVQIETVRLPGSAMLTTYKSMFHVEQRR
jgi:16S rRNA (guanine527-N7)-methyltransferase